MIKMYTHYNDFVVAAVVSWCLFIFWIMIGLIKDKAVCKIPYVTLDHKTSHK